MLKNIVIFVESIDASLRFYKDIFALEPKAWNEGNVVLSGGLVLQDISTWKKATGEKISSSASSCVLYFEESDLVAIKKRLEIRGIDFTETTQCNPSGKPFIRFEDLDGNLIEVAGWSTLK